MWQNHQSIINSSYATSQRKTVRKDMQDQSQSTMASHAVEQVSCPYPADLKESLEFIESQAVPRKFSDDSATNATDSISDDDETLAPNFSSDSDDEKRDCHEDSSKITNCGKRACAFLSRCLLNRWSIGFFAFIAFLALLVMAIIFIGARVEAKSVRDTPETKALYIKTSEVCGLDNFDKLMTFKDATSARDSGSAVAHCGSCGQCSTVQDMEIMGQTKNSLTRDSTKCALKIFLGGTSAVAKCLEERVGFTPPCQDCWVDNIQCTFKSCKFTCLRSRLLGEGNNNGDGKLNSCLQCDEKMCGPEFLSCSGANRRRMGVVSDIARDAKDEQCKQSDIDWRI